MTSKHSVCVHASILQSHQETEIVYIICFKSVCWGSVGIYRTGYSVHSPNQGFWCHVFLSHRGWSTLKICPPRPYIENIWSPRPNTAPIPGPPCCGWFHPRRSLTGVPCSSTRRKLGRPLRTLCPCLQLSKTCVIQV